MYDPLRLCCSLCCSNMVENEESANGYRLAGKADVRLVTPASEAATRRKGGTTGNRGGKRRRVRGTSSMPGTATVTRQQLAVWHADYTRADREATLTCSDTDCSGRF